MTPDFGAFLVQVGDVTWLAGLGLMAVLSWAAGRRILRDERVPMQWGLNGKPTWRMGRRGALMFSPALAALSGLIVTWQAHELGPVATKGALGIAMVRALMAFSFVAAHAIHLAVAIRTLDNERRKPSGSPDR